MTEVLAELLVPFSYNYMLKAMWVSALVGGVCAFLSAYLMLKGWSLMGDALAHSIVPGVAAAYILGAPFAIGAFFAGILASLGMNFVKQQTRLREDAVIGLVFTSLFALGLLMASLWPTSVNIQTIVLGNILAIADEDVVQVAIIAGVSFVIMVFIWKDLMVTFFDESHARSIGLNTTLLKVIFFTLLSACTVAALQTVGACLVIAMVVTPGRDRLSAHRPLRPPDRDQRRARRHHELRRRLYQLLPRRRDRRRDRQLADAVVPCGVLLRTQARPARRPPASAPRDDGGRRMRRWWTGSRGRSPIPSCSGRSWCRCWSRRCARCCPAIWC